jgi:hypothetical protein
MDLRQHPARRCDHSEELQFEHGQMPTSLPRIQSLPETSLNHIYKQSLKAGSVFVADQPRRRD